MWGNNPHTLIMSQKVCHLYHYFGFMILWYDFGGVLTIQNIKVFKVYMLDMQK